MNFNRRSFLKGIAAASAATVLPARKSIAAVNDESYATLIDLTKCDGCEHQDTPECVLSCKSENAHKFPEPDPAMLKNYWPQPKFEDWSKKRGITNRLTPYNWLFVQKVKVEVDGETKTANIPRRCMHCDNPPCANLCPFGSMTKTKEGPVYVKDHSCFGGAKCRTVCPWDVPQRQAGVGIYTYLDPMPVGGGVMYKCDLCRDRLQVGKKPACVEACPKDALKIGTRSEITKAAEQFKKQSGGYVYGDVQNGGTSTLYLSDIPFEKIDQALVAQAKNPKKLMRLHKPGNMMEKHSNWAVTALLAPFLGAMGAFASTISKKEQKHETK
jgi:Fe-S-cluster-containing dehydrogenase component